MKPRNLPTTLFGKGTKSHEVAVPANWILIFEEEVRASLELRYFLPQMDKMHTDSSGFAADCFLG